MDEQTLKTMPLYIQELPPIVRDFIFEGSWQDRTEEIAKKYSLNESQTNILVDNVLFVLIGIDKGEDFIKLMPSELGISKLLSGQIVEELETRVFDYSIKSIQNKLPKKENETVPQPNQKPPLKTQISKPLATPPEIRPDILPMIEDGESVKVLEPKKPDTPAHTNQPHRKIPSSFWEDDPNTTPKKVVDAKQNNLPNEPRIHFKPKDIVEEKVAQPLPVPRFVAKNDNELKQERVPVSDTVPERLNVVTPPIRTIENRTEVPESKPAPKYAVDPYREPIE